MDAKITLRFEESVIDAAKKYAEKHNMSLSRLTEFLYIKMTDNAYSTIEELPIADWVAEISEGETVYTRKSASRKSLNIEYFERKK